MSSPGTIAAPYTPWRPINSAPPSARRMKRSERKDKKPEQQMSFAMKMQNMKTEKLSSGIPNVKDYENLARSGLFLDMEAFSSAFLIRNKQHLESYSKKWVPDPLHQWSRQWEYPFVYERIASH